MLLRNILILQWKIWHNRFWPNVVLQKVSLENSSHLIWALYIFILRFSSLSTQRFEVLDSRCLSLVRNSCSFWELNQWLNVCLFNVIFRSLISRILTILEFPKSSNLPKIPSSFCQQPSHAIRHKFTRIQPVLQSV